MSFDLKIQNGDIQISGTNDLATVENTEKLVQDVIKMVSTEIGANPLFPWYGSPITKSLVGTAYSTQFISNIATSQLQASLETLQNLQKTQAATNQIVTPQEQIAAVSDINIKRNINDLRFFRILLTVLSKAYQQITIPINVQI